MGRGGRRGETVFGLEIVVGSGRRKREKGNGLLETLIWVWEKWVGN